MSETNDAKVDRPDARSARDRRDRSDPSIRRRGNPFTNLKVGVKVAMGSGAIMAFLIVVSAVSYFGLSGGNDNFAEYRGLARQTNEMGRVQANLLAGRLNVKDFLLENSDEAAQSVRERIQATVEVIEGAKALFDTAEEVAAVERAAKELHEYQQAFEEVTELAHERNALVAQMNQIGPKAEADLSRIMDSAFQAGDAAASYLAGVTLRDLLLARLYANRFLVDNKKESAERAIQELTEFDHAAERMRDELQNPERHALAVEVFELAKQYEAVFEKTAEVIYKRNAIIEGSLDVIGPKVAEEMETIKLHNKELQDELGPRATAAMENAETTALVVSALAIVLGILFAFFTGRAISRPVVAMTSAMGRLAQGELGVEIPAVGRRDEIGQMAEAVQVFKDNAIEKQRLDAERAREQAAKQAEAERIRSVSDTFKVDVRGVLEALTSAATELESTAQSMSATAEETNRQSTAVAAAAEEASTNVQTVAAAAEELTSSIDEVGRQVAQSTKIAGSAVTEAEATNASVKGLAQAAEKIGAVVSLIQDIAEQTNLLALNATIEAARAGEAGKGFAVVASEVKSLANQTAKATEEIGGQIAAIQSSTGSAVQAIEGIGKIIHELDEIASSIASAVEEQGAATQEIARNVQQAAQGTGEVSTNIGGVTQAASETGSASTEVLTAAQDLAKQSERLRLEIDRFLTSIEAA